MSIPLSVLVYDVYSLIRSFPESRNDDGLLRLEEKADASAHVLSQDATGRAYSSTVGAFKSIPRGMTLTSHASSNIVMPVSSWPNTENS